MKIVDKQKLLEWLEEFNYGLHVGEIVRDLKDELKAAKPKYLWVTFSGTKTEMNAWFGKIS